MYGCRNTKEIEQNVSPFLLSEVKDYIKCYRKDLDPKGDILSYLRDEIILTTNFDPINVIGDEFDLKLIRYSIVSKEYHDDKGLSDINEGMGKEEKILKELWYNYNGKKKVLPRFKKELKNNAETSK